MQTSAPGPTQRVLPISRVACPGARAFSGCLEHTLTCSKCSHVTKVSVSVGMGVGVGVGVGARAFSGCLEHTLTCSKCSHVIKVSVSVGVGVGVTRCPNVV